MQAQNFYINLLNNPDYILAMRRFGYDESKIQQEQAFVQAISDAQTTQNIERSQAQLATKKRNETLSRMLRP